MRFDLKAPCNACPFRKDSAPGWLGPHTPEDLVRQLQVAEYWTCHKTVTETISHDEAFDAGNAVQHCAGAAAMMRNACKLPRDPFLMAYAIEVGKRDDVFSHWSHFLEHHKPPK